METVTLKVTGMSCAHCEKAVMNALEDFGVTGFANAGENSVIVTFDAATHSLEAIKKEITDCGYTVA